jgi:DNA-directed RNA polymerase sigma subunit (sigma70/sigma32)
MPTVSLAKPKMTRRRHKKYPGLTPEQQALVEEHKWISGRLAYGAKCLTGGHTGSLTREDLESIANFALCVAATRYKPEMSVKYSTYAWNTARGYIQHALRDYSRMVRTPRWVANYKNQVSELASEGKSYREIADILGLDEAKVLNCEMSSNNYHVSYDSSPDDWVTPEFVYDFEEHKATLLSPELIAQIRLLSEAEMTMLMKYIEGSPVSAEEHEWAAEKFFELRGIAHGLSGQLSDEPFSD